MFNDMHKLKALAISFLIDFDLRSFSLLNICYYPPWHHASLIEIAYLLSVSSVISTVEYSHLILIKILCSRYCCYRHLINQSSQMFSVKVQIVSVFNLVGHTVSITTSHLCSYSAKVAIDNA